MRWGDDSMARVAESALLAAPLLDLTFCPPSNSGHGFARFAALRSPRSAPRRAMRRGKRATRVERLALAARHRLEHEAISPPLSISPTRSAAASRLPPACFASASRPIRGLWIASTELPGAHAGHPGRTRGSGSPPGELSIRSAKTALSGSSIVDRYPDRRALLGARIRGAIDRRSTATDAHGWPGSGRHCAPKSRCRPRRHPPHRGGSATCSSGRRSAHPVDRHAPAPRLPGAPSSTSTSLASARGRRSLFMRIDAELDRHAQEDHLLSITSTSTIEEATDEARAACGRLADAGVPAGNDTVLLRGVNLSCVPSCS